MTDRFFIAPYDQNSGQQTNYKPWLIPDEAFQELTNAYVFRGRVRKRFGSRFFNDNALLSRLRVNIGTITGGNFSGNVRAITGDAGLPANVGQAFSVSITVFTVVDGSAGPQNMLRTDNSASTATYDVSTSDVVIQDTGFPDGTPVYFYPALPVMGLLSVEGANINNEFIMAFDQRFAYQYSGGWNRANGESVAGASRWTGNNAQFFWGATWSGVNAADKVFFVTNFNETEPNFMRYFFAGLWNNFRPKITSSDFLNCARIILPFKNRLVALNTWEGSASPGINYTNRCRYSQVGSPLDADSWRQDIPGRGNALDAPTSEAIVTAEFIKDRLIVFFERSTWELAYTGNQAYPFTWQKINTELGAESTFSIVPFDKVTIGVGNVGIHACNGSNVERVDEKIPQTVFDIHNVDNGIYRVYGIRDYYVEMVYWTFPDTDTNADFPYPSRVLVYNYRTGTWAFNEDSITAFGYFQPITGLTWDSTAITWDDEVSWDSGAIQALFRQVVAGNQEGYTFICDADKTTNASALQITNVELSVSGTTTITSIDHNMRLGQYVYIERCVWSDSSNGLNGQIFQVTSIGGPNEFDIGPSAPFTGSYRGGGLIARVSNINVLTKEYNFYQESGRNSYISKVDFMVEATPAGQIQVEFYVSTSLVPLLKDSAGTGALLGTGTLDTFAYPTIPFESQATRLWHPVYLQADGEIIQMQLTMNDAQMRNVSVRDSDFQLHAMCIYAQPTSARFQ